MIFIRSRSPQPRCKTSIERSGSSSAPVAVLTRKTCVVRVCTSTGQPVCLAATARRIRNGWLPEVKSSWSWSVVTVLCLWYRCASSPRSFRHVTSLNRSRMCGESFK
eukprot:SAG22_NODE_1780_length_3600_cov_1.391888_3_plen_107_part_00